MSRGSFLPRIPTFRLDFEANWLYTKSGMPIQRLPFRQLALAILLTWAAAAAVVVAQPQAVVRLEPSSIRADPGESIEVRVVIDDVRNLGAFQFDLACDPNVLKLSSISIGDFPASTGRNVNPLGPKIDATTGHALFGAFSFGDSPGPDGSGVLAVVTLTALAPGQCELALNDVQVVDTSGARLPVTAEGGMVVVSGGQATQPNEVASPTAPGMVMPTLAIPLIATPSPTEQPGDASGATWREWATVVAALVGAVGLVVLLARQLARSV